MSKKSPAELLSDLKAIVEQDNPDYNKAAKITWKLAKHPDELSSSDDKPGIEYSLATAARSIRAQLETESKRSARIAKALDTANGLLNIADQDASKVLVCINILFTTLENNKFNFSMESRMARGVTWKNSTKYFGFIGKMRATSLTWLAKSAEAIRSGEDGQAKSVALLTLAKKMDLFAKHRTYQHMPLVSNTTAVNAINGMIKQAQAGEEIKLADAVNKHYEGFVMEALKLS